MIRFQDVRFAYPLSTKVFDGLSFELEVGHVYGLLGLNGSGKTTLLHLLSGLLFATGGTVTVDGQSPAKRLPETLEQLFYMPDEFTLPARRLWKMVRSYAPFYPQFAEDVLFACLDAFGMGGDLQLDELSLGQRKKVMISFALASGCRHLLMDEPTDGLDIPSKQVFRQLVARYVCDGQMLVVSSHLVHDIAQLLDGLLILCPDGRLWQSEVSAVTSRYRFETRASDAGVRYAEPSAGGFRVITEASAGDETQMDLELLFNAVTKGVVL